MTPFSCGLPEVVESYCQYLEVRSPAHASEFRKREGSDPVAANAEAAIFSLLRECRLNPEVAEVLGVGGPDFLCSNGDTSFLVEVSHVSGDAVRAASGWPIAAFESDQVFTYSSITALLRRKLSKKAAQLADQPVARVLVLVTQHEGGATLFGREAVRRILLSDPKLSAKLGTQPGATTQITTLADSGFVRFSEAGVESCRRPISAVLLVWLREHDCHIVGALHPDPIVPFSIQHLPRVPFARLVQWPLQDDVLDVEWTQALVDPWVASHAAVQFTDEELRQP